RGAPGAGVAEFLVRLRAQTIDDHKEASVRLVPKDMTGPIVVVEIREARAAQAGFWKVVYGQPFRNRRNRVLVKSIDHIHAIQVIGRQTARILNQENVPKLAKANDAIRAPVPPLPAETSLVTLQEEVGVIGFI